MSRATNCIGSFLSYKFGLPQINHNDLAFFVQHEIGCFDIPINISFMVHRSHDFANLCAYNFDYPLIQGPHHLQ